MWRNSKSGPASSSDEAQSHSAEGRIPLRKLWEYVNITGRNVHKGKLSTQDLVLIEGYDSLNEHNIVGQVRYVNCLKKLDNLFHSKNS